MFLLISAHQKMVLSQKQTLPVYACFYLEWTIQSCCSGLVWHLIEYISEECIEYILPNISYNYSILTFLSTSKILYDGSQFPRFPQVSTSGPAAAPGSAEAWG